MACTVGFDVVDALAPGCCVGLTPKLTDACVGASNKSTIFNTLLDAAVTDRQNLNILAIPTAVVGKTMLSGGA